MPCLDAPATGAEGTANPLIHEDLCARSATGADRGSGECTIIRQAQSVPLTITQGPFDLIQPDAAAQRDRPHPAQRKGPGDRYRYIPHPHSRSVSPRSSLSMTLSVQLLRPVGPLFGSPCRRRSLSLLGACALAPPVQRVHCHSPSSVGPQLSRMHFMKRRHCGHRRGVRRRIGFLGFVVLVRSVYAQRMKKRLCCWFCKRTKALKLIVYGYCTFQVPACARCRSSSGH